MCIYINILMSVENFMKSKGNFGDFRLYELQENHVSRFKNYSYEPVIMKIILDHTLFIKLINSLTGKVTVWLTWFSLIILNMVPICSLLYSPSVMFPP